MAGAGMEERNVRQTVRFFALPLTRPGLRRSLDGKTLVRTAAVSLALVAGISAVLAVASGWVRSQVYYFGSGAPLTPPWLDATVEHFALLVLPYPVWVLLIAALHRATDPTATWLYRVALACRFVLAYVFAWAIPAVYAWLLLGVFWLTHALWIQIPAAVRVSLTFGTWAAFPVIGLFLLVAGIVVHRRARGEDTLDRPVNKHPDGTANSS
jgi:hypothetical protein